MMPQKQTNEISFSNMTVEQFVINCGILGTLTTTAGIGFGHVFLPDIGLKSALLGGGSLSTAAIAYLAGGGISLIPAMILFFFN